MVLDFPVAPFATVTRQTEKAETEQQQGAGFGYRIGVQLDGGVNPERGGYGMALCEEKIEIIVVSGSQPQGVKIYSSTCCRMDPAKVNGQGFVDEDPEVVIAGECKTLTCLVGEVGVQLKGEMIVVSVSFIAEKLVVNGEEALYSINGLRSTHSIRGILASFLPQRVDSILIGSAILPRCLNKAGS